MRLKAKYGIDTTDGAYGDDDDADDIDGCVNDEAGFGVNLDLTAVADRDEGF